MSESAWFNVPGDFESKRAIRVSAIAMMTQLKDGYIVHVNGERFKVDPFLGGELLNRLGWTSVFQAPEPPKPVAPPPKEEKKPVPPLAFEGKEKGKRGK